MKRNWGYLFLAALLLFSGLAYSQTFKTDADVTALGYKQVYSYDIPNNPNLTNGATYRIDNTASFSGDMIESIAYRVNLGTDNFAFISMDAFTQDATKMGVPTFTSNAAFQQYVGNLYYEAKSPNLTTAGTHVNQGNIEFWPNNYGGDNAKGIPNAANTFDFGDTRNGDGNHGSMQIHDYQKSQVVFAFNNWNGGSNGSLGIGNNTIAHTDGNTYPDWTFRSTVNGYSTKTIDVYAKPVVLAATGDKLTAIESDMANMSLVNKYIIPTDNVAGIVKSIDNSANGALAGMPIKRVGYYYELTKGADTTYAYTSFDSLTNNVAKIGMPLNDGNWYHQSSVNNMTVVSNSANVANGTGLTGNVEIWAGNYSEGNAANVPGASGSAFDFGDTRNAGVGHGSFQIHNTDSKQTVFAINDWRVNSPDTGIGSQPTGNPDWTFAKSANTYDSAKLLVMAEPAIAPMMDNVANGSQYTLVQGSKISQNMKTNLHNLSSKELYNICNNVQTLKDSGVWFDRVGYYMEYAPTGDEPLTYVFVSFEAQTTDVSKIGIPTASSGIFYQQTVKNLEITSNVKAAQGILTDGSGNQVTAGQTYSFDEGYLEFWPSGYVTGNSGVISSGNGAIYDINDSGASTAAGHGSMQIHNLDTGETVFSFSGLNQTKQYGIGTNPKASTNNGGPQADWTFADQSGDPNISKTGYKIANVYTFVHEVDALLTTQDYAMFQRTDSGVAEAQLTGTWAAKDGKSISLVQASADGGTTWTPMTINADGTFSGSMVLDSGTHKIQYQALDASGSVITSTSGKIGVGEIFITAGQSNSTNCGDSPQASTSGNAWAYNFTTGQWQVANDPQPVTINGKGDGSTKGSTWPSFADALSEQLGGIPVGVVSVGWGGSSIAQWNPNNVDTSADGWETIEFQKNNQTLFGRMALAIDTLDGKFAGILWHQGESDDKNTKEGYQAALEALIEASREEAGWDVPWAVALASCNAAGTSFQQILDAQLAVIEGDSLVFLGPNTDELARIYRGTNGNSIHLSALGLDWTGSVLWTQSARELLGVPEPSTWALLVLGALGIVWFRKRKTA